MMTLAAATTAADTLRRTISEVAADAAHYARCGVPPWLWYKADRYGGIALAATRMDELPSRIGNGWSLLLAHPIPADVPWSLYPEFVERQVALISPGVRLILESR